MILKINIHNRKDKPLVSGTLKGSTKSIIQFLRQVCDVLEKDTSPNQNCTNCGFEEEDHPIKQNLGFKDVIICEKFKRAHSK